MMLINELIQKTEAPEGVVGDWSIQHFSVSEEDVSFFNLHMMINYQGHRQIKPGVYSRLVHKEIREPIMSDTPAEIGDHWAPVAMAKGHCLINGLGLAIVAEACLRKKKVEHVTVIERSKEVIELMSKYLFDRWSSSQLTIINDDALTYSPPKGIRYGMVWHDIWNNICSDNLPQMHTLHRRYGRRADWQGSWAREMCERGR